MKLIQVGFDRIRLAALGQKLPAEAIHLVPGWFAIVGSYPVIDLIDQGGGRFLSHSPGQFLQHHGAHRWQPARTDPGKRAIEINEGNFGLAGRCFPKPGPTMGEGRHDFAKILPACNLVKESRCRKKLGMIDKDATSGTVLERGEKYRANAAEILG